jgi:serine phosphatase RsbU (regulator of sigma subunit)
VIASADHDLRFDKDIEHDMSPTRILIIDDNRIARDLLTRELGRQGYDCVACNDGREALQLIDTAPPSLIICDYEMPEFTGAQVCELIRQHRDPEIAALPIILLTAHSGDDPELESLAAGANDFVTKPINTAVLRARIETHLRLHALRQELEAQKAELENYRHNHEQDLEAAQITQQAILPVRLPKIAGWETAAHYQPVIQVGGDMYDWVRLPDGGWVFWISDATGHGASAALLTTLTKLVFRHAASEFGSPCEILRAVNAEFHAILRGKSFMTAACVLLRPDSGVVAFCGAGHPPLLVARAAGPVLFLRSQGPPLGILAEWESTEESVELSSGETALLYTDGLYSASDEEGRRLGPEDLAGLIPHGSASAEEFLRRTIENVFAPDEKAALPDDLAAIALRRNPPT